MLTRRTLCVLILNTLTLLIYYLFGAIMSNITLLLMWLSLKLRVWILFIIILSFLHTMFLKLLYIVNRSVVVAWLIIYLLCMLIFISTLLSTLWLPLCSILNPIILVILILFVVFWIELVVLLLFALFFLRDNVQVLLINFMFLLSRSLSWLLICLLFRQIIFIHLCLLDLIWTILGVKSLIFGISDVNFFLF